MLFHALNRQQPYLNTFVTFSKVIITDCDLNRIIKKFTVFYVNIKQIAKKNNDKSN